MTHMFTLAKRPARLRAPLLVLLTLAFGACDSAERLSNTTVEDPTTTPVAAAPVDAETDTTLALADTLGATDLSDPTGGVAISDDEVSPIDDVEETEASDVQVVDANVLSMDASSSALSLSAFRGGIPFGTFHLPKQLYGRVFNGSMGNISRGELMGYLAQARRTGTRVLLTFSGNEANFKNSNRSFSLAKWKSRVARYKGLNLSSYIKDGTIIGHYLMDEPHDPHNWGGRLVSRATVDAMAKYSKQLWPSLPTVVRSWPAYLKGYRYRYLDAAWAQYSARKGPIGSFTSQNVNDAKRAGLKLVVGMNLLDGGNKSSRIKGNLSGKYAMSASQLRQWGAVLMSNSYVCAFLSWKYSAKYIGRSDIKSAMSYLAGKARGSRAGSCRAR
jgi:hypothetical protein